MTTTSSANRLLIEKFILWAIVAIWGLALTFGIRLANNIRSDVDETAAISRANEIVNVKQEAAIESLKESIPRMEKKLDQVLKAKYGFIPDKNET